MSVPDVPHSFRWAGGLFGPERECVFREGVCDRGKLLLLARRNDAQRIHELCSSRRQQGRGTRGVTASRQPNRLLYLRVKGQLPVKSGRRHDAGDILGLCISFSITYTSRISLIHAERQCAASSARPCYYSSVRNIDPTTTTPTTTNPPRPPHDRITTPPHARNTPSIAVATSLSKRNGRLLERQGCHRAGGGTHTITTPSPLLLLLHRTQPWRL